ncbi:MAG: lactate racemase domain-containing protein [Petrotogales bacterium]
MEFTKLYKINRNVAARKVTNIPQNIEQELKKINLKNKIGKSDQVAITAGSRGIANISHILKSVVNYIKKIGANPFIIPSMGSHGGANPDGQVEVLRSLGITEKRIDCNIKSSMEVVNVGETSRGTPIFVDKIASESDGIIVINRVKPHTLYEGKIESGLCKMMVIGMGNQKGASVAHAWSLRWRLKNMIPEIATGIINKLPIIGGIALVENFYDELNIISGIKPDNFITKEKQLLKKAYKMMPLLPFDEADILIIDAMGKNISGEGIDPNVVGRRVFQAEPAPEKPDVTRIFIRSLTEESHGNAIGTGLADFVHQRVIDSMDINPTYMNALTAKIPRDARIPLVVKSDKQGLRYCTDTIGSYNPDKVKIAWIKNTSKLDSFLVSESLLNNLQDNGSIEVQEENISLRFNNAGDISEELL